MIIDTQRVAAKVTNAIIKFFSFFIFPALVLLVLSVEIINLPENIKYILYYIVFVPIVFSLSIVLSVINGHLWIGLMRKILDIKGNIIMDSMIFSVVIFIILPIAWANDNHIHILPIIIFYTIPAYIMIFLLWHGDFGDYKSRYANDPSSP